MTTSSAPNLEGPAMSHQATRMITGGAGGAGRVIWLTPGTPAITVAGQRRDLTELPPQGSRHDAIGSTDDPASSVDERDTQARRRDVGARRIRERVQHQRLHE